MTKPKEFMNNEIGVTFRPRPIWSSDLQCEWSSLSVVDDGIIRLDMPHENCCDMNGVIKVAQAIHPVVFRIDTYSGGKPDTMYVKIRNKWEAVDKGRAIFFYSIFPAACNTNQEPCDDKT